MLEGVLGAQPTRIHLPPLSRRAPAAREQAAGLLARWLAA
eukprot:COSAG04_NODE_16132_length_509_cov_0.736585_1_plen_39_part_10